MMGTYDEDFAVWSEQQGALLRRLAAGDLVNNADLDWENIAEEIESLGRAEKRELVNRLAVLLAHLLKWQIQPGRRGNSWRLTIAEQRRKLDRHLQDNPTLKASLDGAITAAYGDALLRVQRQTGLAESVFPAACPYTAAQLLDASYLPESMG